jgi:ion channel-forming bestrophin family protein
MQALSVTLFSAFIVVYNLLIEVRILPKFLPLFTSPPLPFNLTSSALGLLLVFRTNAAYSRWKDARIAWAVISAKSFDVMRQSIAWIDEHVSASTASANASKLEKIEHANFIKSKICRYLIAYAKSLKWVLGHQGNDRRLIEDLNGVLDHKEMEALVAARHRPQHLLAQITYFIKVSRS